MQTLTETYGELSRLFGDYYALSVTQLFAFGDKHAAFERNGGSMSLFEKFELAREVSDICDSVVPLIKVVIVEGGGGGGGGGEKWGGGDGGDAPHHVVAAVHAAAAAAADATAAVDAAAVDDRRCDGGAPGTWCRNPFGAIMDDDVDVCRKCRGPGKRPRTSAAAAAAGKCIELKVYSRSVNYFHEQPSTTRDDRPPSARFPVARLFPTTP